VLVRILLKSTSSKDMVELSFDNVKGRPLPTNQ
jgi:hypothetical protein